MLIDKKIRFIVTSLLLTFGFTVLLFVHDQNRVLGISILSILTLVLFTWSLWEGLGINMTLLSIVLPMAFTLGVGYFWFLLPTGLITRIPILTLFCLGIYALCSTSNIFTVSAIKTIPLVRSARGIGFVISLITYFLIMDTILSLRSYAWINVLVTFIVSLPLFMQGYWSINLDKNISKNLLLYSFIASFIISQLSLILFFWPVKIVVGSLFLTSFFYILLGLGQAKLEERYFSSTIREYLMVGILVFIGMYFATSWNG